MSRAGCTEDTMAKVVQIHDHRTPVRLERAAALRSNEWHERSRAWLASDKPHDEAELPALINACPQAHIDDLFKGMWGVMYERIGEDQSSMEP